MEGHNGSTRLPGADMPLVVKCVLYPLLYTRPQLSLSHPSLDILVTTRGECIHVVCLSADALHARHQIRRCKEVRVTGCSRVWYAPQLWRWPAADPLAGWPT